MDRALHKIACKEIDLMGEDPNQNPGHKGGFGLVWQILVVYKWPLLRKFAIIVKHLSKLLLKLRIYVVKVYNFGQEKTFYYKMLCLRKVMMLFLSTHSPNLIVGNLECSVLSFRGSCISKLFRPYYGRLQPQLRRQQENDNVGFKFEPRKGG